jgi:hypothetical protein
MTSTLLIERRRLRRRRRRLALAVAIPSMVAILEMGPAAQAAGHDAGFEGTPPANGFFELPAPHAPLGLGVVAGVLATPVLYVSHRRGRPGKD